MHVLMGGLGQGHGLGANVYSRLHPEHFREYSIVLTCAKSCR